jgi:hypothetical protein
MNRQQAYKYWQAQAGKNLRRVWVWTVNYFALNRPLAWQASRYSVGSWNVRTGQALFYLGVLAGSFAAYFYLGGPLNAGDPASVTDAQALAEIALAVLLYPAVHRAARFEDLRTSTGSLLAAGMYGFTIPLIIRIFVS